MLFHTGELGIAGNMALCFRGLLEDGLPIKGGTFFVGHGLKRFRRVTNNVIADRHITLAGRHNVAGASRKRGQSQNRNNLSHETCRSQVLVTCDDPVMIRPNGDQRHSNSGSVLGMRNTVRHGRQESVDATVEATGGMLARV